MRGKKNCGVKIRDLIEPITKNSYDYNENI